MATSSQTCAPASSAAWEWCPGRTWGRSTRCSRRYTSFSSVLNRGEIDVAEVDLGSLGLQGDLAGDLLRVLSFVQHLAIDLQGNVAAVNRDLILVPLADRLLVGPGPQAMARCPRV